jgi:hypothetical protein
MCRVLLCRVLPWRVACVVVEGCVLWPRDMPSSCPPGLVYRVSPWSDQAVEKEGTNIRELSTNTITHVITISSIWTFLTVLSANIDKTRHVEQIWRNIVQIVKMNNSSSNIFTSTIWFLRKFLQIVSSAEVSSAQVLNKSKCISGSTPGLEFYLLCEPICVSLRLFQMYINVGLNISYMIKRIWNKSYFMIPRLDVIIIK